MSVTLNEERQGLAALDAELAQLRQRAAQPDADLDALSDAINRETAKRSLLAERLAALEAAERRKASEAAEQTAEKTRRQQEAELRKRQADLSRRWRAWGETMTEIDERLPHLWAEYRALATEGLQLGKDAHAAGLALNPDTSAAEGVLARIVSDASGLKDRHRG